MTDTKTPTPTKTERKQRGRIDRTVMFPLAPSKVELPEDYSELLVSLKQRIQQERLRIVLSSNAAMTLLYWDIGKRILEKQQTKGWGAKIINRLSFDLREQFPEMKGFSPRNLGYMKAFATAWPDPVGLGFALSQIAQDSDNVISLKKARAS